MASQLENVASTSDRSMPERPRQHSDHNLSPDMPPLFRFRLRHIFLFVTLVSTFLAALVASQGLPAMAMLLAALVVTFHVFSTALGTQLREHTNRTLSLDRPNFAPPVKSTEKRQVLRLVKENQSPWYVRSGFPFPMLPRIVAMSICFGGCLGATILAVTIGHRISLPGLIVGTISVAALSGWFAFIAGSFYGIVREGLREAAADQRKM